ncbi:helicase-related protein [Armatimonas sp.]|uniref:helicase-related protein n=1 Tax=Armatimonas sp. TaxID=1872638 RepID=UPI00286B9FA2|nr:helicase-related protein [Armatimonas sp.]
MLDPLNNKTLSEGRFPPKLFAFTDNLDVANRFYHTLKDAESFARRGRGGHIDKYPLALERNGTNNGRPWPDAAERRKFGQIWDACKQLGGAPLLIALPLDKVNSKDAGVDPKAKVIVATSSLEVGYDDSTVGAVLQHKAARGAASFLQRKGRAGRHCRIRDSDKIATWETLRPTYSTPF